MGDVNRVSVGKQPQSKDFDSVSKSYLLGLALDSTLNSRLW